MRNWSILKNNWDILIIFISYFFLVILIFPYFQFKILGDEISYINIAHAYALGHWANAINGYWSPMYSWLMVPFLIIFGFKPIYGVYISKFISIFIGLFTIFCVRRMSQKLDINKNIERILLFVLVPSITFFVLLYNTPDLLLASLLILYLSILFQRNYADNLKYAVLCGIIGALAFFTKSFAFPFFIITFILFNLIFYFRIKIQIQRKNILKGSILGLTIFLLISGLWIGVIDEKYDKPTISTSGEYNQALVGPEYKVNIMDTGISPIYYKGLIEPPNEDTISIWDEFSYMNLDKWNPFGSWQNMNYELNLIVANIVYSFNITESYLPIAIILLISMVVVAFSKSIKKTSRNNLKYLLLTIFVYTGGYCLITPEWRYLWFIFLLLMISGFYIIDLLNKNNVITVKTRNIMLIFLICTLIFQPILEINYFVNQKDNSYYLSNSLQKEFNINGNLASNSWSTLEIAYYLNSKFYGNITTDNSTLLNQELMKFNIDYYFSWNSTSNYNLSNYHEITNNKIDGLKIYSRK
ncbi:hypothetical protein Metbo_0729 [Methanobacterium lacus]|uniref:Uncharacterized protein n=1 Tax=Methanobacterium lacus (strain AL-21) TaxID=877455 RepID=F0TAV4_METLA|nr:glycosyltransferase family 39 protein [Methanobacterium lacus]ADZ08980.1 hypothetical protein Metbo_0729 [Methanobacterium lacus]